MKKNNFTLIKFLVFVVIIAFFYNPLSFGEITESQKKVIKSQIILVHEGMISLDSLYNKTKIFDKTGIFGIGKSEMSKKEFKSFFDKQSIHYGY